MFQSPKDSANTYKFCYTYTFISKEEVMITEVLSSIQRAYVRKNCFQSNRHIFEKIVPDNLYHSTLFDVVNGVVYKFNAYT